MGSTHPKSGEGVRSDVESGEFDVLKEKVEIFVFEDEFCKRLVPHALSQHHATVECNLRVFIPLGVGGV